MANNIHENEAWWQQNGMGWADEVDKRRSLQPLYGIQEVVLTHIFSQLPKKSKVLEFGVGFGRHVDYLSDIDELEVHGVDQSPTMLESLKANLSHKPDLIKNIVLIQPRTRLPYPDNYFDFVYTVSVLIHINPADMEEILKELTRVTKHGIIHFENNYTDYSELKFMDHNGCWQHSIVDDYSKLNLRCSVLTKVASDQDLYYTEVSNNWSKEDLANKVMFSRLYLMDSRIRPTILKFEGEIGWRAKELEERIERESQMMRELTLFNEQIANIKLENEMKKKEIDEQNIQISMLDSENKQLSTNLNSLESRIEEQMKEVSHLISSKVLLETQLYDIESSLAWRSITKLRNMKYIYRLTKPARKILNFVRKRRSNAKKQYTDATTSETLMINHNKNDGNSSLNKKIRNILDLIPKGSDIAIYQPEWLGVSHSTRELFASTLPINELFDINEITSLGQMIASQKPKSIIFSGFAIGYYDLAKAIKISDPGISIKIYWHGNTTHMYEDYSWSRYQEIIQLCNEGVVDGWAFAKESMAVLYGMKGFPSFFVKNTVKNEKNEKNSRIEAKQSTDIKVGIYASGNTWNKNAFTQIAAASILENATINAVPYNNRMLSFAQQLSVKMEGSEKAVPREELLTVLASNDINLYVTFSECAPLLPLESLNLGVLCLTGPNHHYFNNNALKDHLVVDRPDDPVEIAKKAELALKNKDLILDLYHEWKQENDIASLTSIQSFLEGK